MIPDTFSYKGSSKVSYNCIRYRYGSMVVTLRRARVSGNIKDNTGDRKQ